MNLAESLPKQLPDAASAYLAARGLLSASDTWNLDCFNNRIVFPILDASGVLIGQQTRRLNDEDRSAFKYTSEPSDIRQRTLFGLPQALAGASREVIVVEGATDVITVSTHGETCVVGALSCDLKPAQAAIIAEHWSHAIVAFDGDEAGNTGALKALPRLRACGVIARAVCLPADHDPDSLVRAEGIQAFRRLLQIH